MRLRKYGVEATIDFSLYEVDGVDLRTDWIPAAADCEIMKDGGVSTQCTNTATDEGSTYSIVLTATEMQAARLVLKIVDAATKVFLDSTVIIETYGNASAQHAFDFDTASTAQTADHTAGIADIPTVAEFNARSLASADYTIVSDLGTVQTGDSYAIVNGTHGLVSIQDDVDAILEDTGTTIPARLTGIEGATFATGTDSLEAIRDRGDAAWVTGAGGSAPTVGEIRTEMETNGGKLDHIWETTEDDVGIRRFTTNALEQAPSGTGGDATEAKQDTIIANLTTVDGIVDNILVDTAEIGVAGAGLTSVGLADDAITSAKYDESTAFPIGSADTGTTEIARTGADSDTLETLSDQVDLQATATALATHDTDIKAEFDSFAVGSAAISKVADSRNLTITPTTETLTYTATAQLDGSYHVLTDDINNDLDFDYQFDVGGNGIPVEFVWDGYVRGNNDTVSVYARNVDAGTWEQIGTITGTAGTTHQTKTFVTTTDHVGTGANDGVVRIRFYSLNMTDIGTDRILCSYAVVAESVGYADGAIWVDSAGTAGAKVYTNGTADNPCPWANALTLNATLGLDRFRIANGNTVTLDANSDNYSLFGENWNLILGGQSIEGLYVEGPNAYVTGTGTATVTPPSFKNCKFGIATLPPCGMLDCGYAAHVTGGSSGQYAIKGGFSLVAGTGSPEFTFTGLAAATGINARGWTGGAKYNLDADCTLSHEVLAGGKTQIVSTAATVEIRGITRELDFDLSGAGTLQFIGITGLIDISGTTTATLNLHGVSTSITDTSSAATVNDYTMNSVDQNAILTDTNSLNDTKIPDIISLAAINAEVDSALDTAISSPTAGSISDYVMRTKYVLNNRLTIDSDGGQAVIHNDSNSVVSTVAGAFTEASTIKTRLKLY